MHRRFRMVGAIGLLALGALFAPAATTAQGSAELLTDPFLQLPQEDSVNVVWMTEFRGWKHMVIYGRSLDPGLYRRTDSTRDMPWMRFEGAETTKFSRLREDASSRVAGRAYTEEVDRDVWRHEAVIEGLKPGVRVPYRVVSYGAHGQYAVSDVFTLAPAPQPSQPLKILLTSDHQLKNNTPANLQKVEETVGRVDAVLVAGDLINVPDRASEWFDDERGLSFFPGLQGHASFTTQDSLGMSTTYVGGELIQYAPLFAVIGNHEVMGRVGDGNLGTEFNDPKPRSVAARAYEEVADEVNPTGNPLLRAKWIKENSYNVDSYLEMFTLPESANGGEKWWATTFGDVRIIGLYATRIWRSPSTNPTGATKYVEATDSLDDEMAQGWGTHIFERVDRGSPQYRWLRRELNSPEFKKAKIHVVLLHHPVHNLGGNVVPAFTDPVRIEEQDDAGQLTAVRYEYPLGDDYLVSDVQPLLLEAGVDLVLNGHSHLWNRFQHPSGTHFLETSNVGNNYGAFTSENGASRPVPPEPWDQSNYAATDDPSGLSPIVPTVAPFLDANGEPQPYLASNDYTAFSILETETSEVVTYIYDTKNPTGGVWEFDRFSVH